MSDTTGKSTMASAIFAGVALIISFVSYKDSTEAAANANRIAAEAASEVERFNQKSILQKLVLSVNSRDVEYDDKILAVSGHLLSATDDYEVDKYLELGQIVIFDRIEDIDQEVDELLTHKNKLQDINQEFLNGLIIRTLPNAESKKSRDYMKETPSFFSIDAMEYIVSLGVEHLLVDTPSVDRLLDDGHLSAHNIFWETKGKEFNPNTKNKTITEMIFASENIKDGGYLLNLQIPAFVSDAAPSRPILYKVNDL